MKTKPNRRRLVYVGASLICLVTIFWGGFLLLPTPLLVEPGITPENFKRLHAGMTEGEIEAVLGRPADHTSDNSVMAMGGRRAEWFEKGYSVVVMIDLLRTQPVASWGQMACPDGSTLSFNETQVALPKNRLRHWLGLR